MASMTIRSAWAGACCGTLLILSMAVSGCIPLQGRHAYRQPSGTPRSWDLAPHIAPPPTLERGTSPTTIGTLIAELRHPELEARPDYVASEQIFAMATAEPWLAVFSDLPGR